VTDIAGTSTLTQFPENTKGLKPWQHTGYAIILSLLDKMSRINQRIKAESEQ